MICSKFNKKDIVYQQNGVKILRSMVKLQKTRQNFHEFKVAAIDPRPILLTQPNLFSCEFYRTFRLLF